MEYAKDGVFRIRYNTKKQRLEIKPRKWTSSLKNKIKGHKLLTTAIIAFIIFSTINMIMIYNFVNILQNI